MDFGPFFESCLGTEACNFNFVSALFPKSLFAPTRDSKFGRLGLLKPSFRIEGIAKKQTFIEIVCDCCLIDFCRFLEASGEVCFQLLLPWKQARKLWMSGGVTDPKSDGI